MLTRIKTQSHAIESFKIKKQVIQKEEIFCFYPKGTQYYYTCVTLDK